MIHDSTMRHPAKQPSRQQENSSGSRSPRLAVPREHGTWGMWIVPGVVGAALAKANYHLSALFLIAILLLFWARYPVWLWMRSRTRTFPSSVLPSTLVIGLAGLALAIGLAAAYERWALIGFGALTALVMGLHLWLVVAGRERSLAAEFLGIAGLGLVGPATYYAASGSIDAEAALSWLLPALFFGTSVFAIKLRVEGYARVKAGAWPIALAAALLGYQTLAIVAVVLLVAQGVVAPWVIAAYMPVTAQAAWPMWSLRKPPKFRRLGVLWVTHSVLFAILLVTLM